MRRDDPPATKSTPVEITEDAWHQALNLLPPVAWRNDAAGESFKMGGRLTGSVASIYVRINSRHFQFTDDIRTTHADCCRIVARCQAWRDGRDYAAGNGAPTGFRRAFATEDRDAGR